MYKGKKNKHKNKEFVTRTDRCDYNKYYWYNYSYKLGDKYLCVKIYPPSDKQWENLRNNLSEGWVLIVDEILSTSEVE